jgi:hypothetical protein
MWEGQPAWCFGPPPQNWPAPRDIGYYAETPVIIRGTPYETYYLIADSAFAAFAQFEGLGPNQEIQLDGTGSGTFTIRSKGLLAPNQFLAVEFTVREGSPFVGAPETNQRAMLTDTNWYTRSKDFVKGVFGLDTEGVSGFAGGFFGSLFLVGDAGSLIKNGARAVGLSDQPVNKTEVVFGGLGVAATFSSMAGDTPVAAIRSLIAATDGVKLGKVVANLFLRGLSSGANLSELGNFALRLMRSGDAALQGAKQILTSEELVEASIRAVDKLGDLGGAFLEHLAFKAQAFGIRAAQDITTLFGKLSDDALDVFKNLNPSQLDDALDHLAVVFRTGKIDVAQVKRLLENSRLYTAAYDRSKMLKDLRFLSDSEGFDKLVNYLGSAGKDSWAKGRVYELQSAVGTIKNVPNGNVTFVSRFAKEIDPDTAKVLDHTDIDFIVDDGTNLIYYQAKSTAGAFGRSAAEARREAERWVKLALNDAEQHGITNQLIKYVVPPDVAVPPTVLEYFTELQQQTGIVIEVVTSPLLR